MMRPLSVFAAASGDATVCARYADRFGKRTNNWVGENLPGPNSRGRAIYVSIVGGETSNTRGPAAISVSVAGFVEKDRWVSRRAANWRRPFS